MKKDTVKNIVEKIDSKEILLPSMQRKFVWSESQITNYFDSIMKGYPFGTFIFWKINNKTEMKKYRFYQFIKDFSKRDSTINQIAGEIGKKEIDVVMDGQQRLTSLYIGIKGSLTDIAKGKKRKIAENWKKKRLYIKPYIAPEDRGDTEEIFRFEFLEDIDAELFNKDKEPYDRYYKVSDFYNMTKQELREYLGVGQIRDNKEDWKTILNNLRWYLNEAEILNYHVIENTNIEDVLEIFKRINNGGTKLSPSNLLFSTVITTWEQGREEMDSLIETINNEGVIYLNEGFLIKLCLYIVNEPSAVKIDALTTNVVNNIRKNWDKIKKSVFKTTKYLKGHNISDEVLLSYNALLPIFYYNYYIDSMDEKSSIEFLNYLVVSQLFGLFGGASANTLDLVRYALCKNRVLGNVEKHFSIEQLFDINLSAGREHAFKISKEQVERLVDGVKYGENRAYLLERIIYPEIKTENGNFDLDHVVSKNEIKQFIHKKSKSSESRKSIESMRDGIPNMQLLEYSQNRGDKNKDTLYTWVVEKGNKIKFDPLREKNDNSLYVMNDIESFQMFYTERREKIINELIAILKIN